MPQYELMYLLGSQVSDDVVPKLTAQVLKFAEDFGASNIKETQLGKKKLAYPIGKTRNGHYVVVNFNMDTKDINLFDAKIRTQDQSIIRYLIVNLDEHLERMRKDKVAQSKIVRKGPQADAAKAEAVAAAAESARKEAPVLAEINSEDLDKKIEAALSEDLTK